MKYRDNIKLISIFNFFSDFRLYSAIAIIYFKDISGSYALGMSVIAINYASSSVFEIPTGVMSDAIGRCKTVLFGAVCILFGTVCYAIAGNYWHLVAGSILCGAGYSFYSGNNDALLYETLKTENRESEYHHILGKTSSMFQLSLAISALIGGFVATASFKWVMWISVVPAALCVIVSLLLVEPDIAREKSRYIDIFTDALRQFAKNKKLRLLSIANILNWSIGDAVHFMQVSLFETLIPIWGIGVYRCSSNAIGALSYWYSGRVISRFGVLRTVLVGTALTIAIQICAFLTNSIATPFMIASVALFYGVVMTAQNTLQQMEFTDSQRATMGSITSFFGNIVFGIISTLMGYAADHVGLINTLVIVLCIKSVVPFMYNKLGCKRHKLEEARARV